MSVLLDEAQKFHTFCRSMHPSSLVRIYVRDAWNFNEVPMSLTGSMDLTMRSLVQHRGHHL